jgi:G3E family GTPase
MPVPHEPAAGPGHSRPVAVVTALDEVLRDSLVASLLLDAPGLVSLRYEVVGESSALRRIVVTAGGVLEDELVDLAHPCVSCAMRENAVPALARLAGRPEVRGILLAPPLSADPSIVVGTLRAHEGAWHLASALAAATADRAAEDLLGDDTLAERELRWADGDARSVGEALAAQLEYSDLLVLEGDEDCAGAELVEHLRAPEQRLVRDPFALSAREVLGGRHDHAAGLRRRDARWVEPYGGPTEHGTWTLDLHSVRPFHPQRLLENIEALGGGRLRGRGRFWVPDRPDSICQWDGAGGQVSIGAVWRTGRELPTTHLVVTGQDPADLPRVRDAFARCLLTVAEWAEGLTPWLGAEDPLAPWLGDRDAKV